MAGFRPDKGREVKQLSVTTALILVVCALAAGGCSRPVGQASAPSTPAPSQVDAEATAVPSPEPTQAAAAAVSNDGKPISTPKTGSTERTALMDAARAKTGSSAKFVVWQLFMQGDSAIGDLQETKNGGALGRRWLVCWHKTGSTWKATYSTRFLDAKRASVLASAGYLSDEIAARMVFMVPFSTPKAVRKAATKAAALDYEESVWVPTHIPEGWAFRYENVNYGKPGGIPGTEHWHLQHFTRGGSEITLFNGSPEGDFDYPRDTPMRVLWGSQKMSLYAASDGRAAIGDGQGSGPDAEYASLMWAKDTSMNRALMSAMALSVVKAKP